MNTLRNIFKNLLTGLLMAGVLGSFAQADKLNRANTLYQGKKFDAARLAIDSVVLHPETAKDPVSWTTRAYIYYEFYKGTDKYKLYSPLRDTILNSIRISNTLKPDADYLKNNNKLAYNLSVGYYNLAKRLLQDSLNDKTSQVAYNRSKEVVKMFKPDSNFTVADVEWYNTVGGIFSDIFNKDNTNMKAQDIAKVALLKVIELQPENWRSNYNLGIMYYNQAVNLGKSLDYGADISQIDVIQESIIKLAKQAEQLIDKVYKKDSKNIKAVEALYYIYRMLNDNAKTDFFKKKCIELGVKVD
jgi:hypothetical protein